MSVEYSRWKEHYISHLNQLWTENSGIWKASWLRKLWQQARQSFGMRFTITGFFTGPVPKTASPLTRLLANRYAANYIRRFWDVLRVQLLKWRLLGRLSASDVHSEMQLGKTSLLSSSVATWALISAKASTKPIHQCLAASLCQLPLLQSTKVAGPCFLSRRCAFFDDAHLILFPWLGIQASKGLRRIFVGNQSRSLFPA